MVREDGALVLQFPENRKIAIDFVNDRKKYLRPLRGRQELIAKAIGLGSRKVVRVFDATVGLGEDLWTMARLGAVVTGCEREPLLAQVLADALERAGENEKTAEIAERISIHHADAIEYLKQLPKSDCPDTVYLDPMFPESKKTALPRMEMQLFRTWLGEDHDIGSLLEMAMATAQWRVVVKRPLKAPLVASPVTHQFKGTSIRYDLYQPRNVHR